jgi:hypothetical protein
MFNEDKEYLMNATQSKSKHAVSLHVTGLRAVDVALQRGATLLEAIAFLAISAIVVLGAVSMLASAFNNADVDKANNELVGLRIGVKKLYSNADGYGAVATNLLPAIIAARALPGTLTVGASNAVTNGWGGAVTVVSAVNAFDISYANIPQDACIGLLVASGQNLWVQITANAAAAPLAFPITPATALAACSNAANGVVFRAR